MSAFKDKTILVTGGTGSIGSELVKQILKENPARIRIYSRDETKQYELMEELGYPPNVQPFIGDVRDRERLEFAFKGTDIVIHAAAMKHVSISEYNPFEVVKTNIVGSQNVIDAAIKQKVKKVIGISTDKAVHPTGILGTSKLMMEKLFINTANFIKKEDTMFSCVRFGNVLWSRGSVLPSWKVSADKDGVIRVTDREMTRFFMSKEDAINLVLSATALAQGGELLTFKMPSISLIDLANTFIEKYYKDKKIKIEVIGLRSGEKMHEELLDHSDLGKYILTDGKIIIIIPKIRPGVIDKKNQPEPKYTNFNLVDKFENISSKDSNNNEAVKNLI